MQFDLFIISATNRRKIISTVLLAAGSAMVHLLSLNSQWIDNQYSDGFYPGFAEYIRKLNMYFGFSLGDILYYVATFVLMYALVKLLSRIKKEKNNALSIMAGFLWNCLNWLFCIYIVFNVLWGFNYNRKGIASQLGVALMEYDVHDLQVLNGLLLEKTNESKEELEALAITEKIEIADLRYMSAQSYGALSQTYPFLQYKNPSLKKSIWGILGNYMGFSGYYNPFTGEAQVNMGIPDFLLPFTACHEVAHQLGYAKENEANFIGYLAATATDDKRMKYAAYFEMFLYANRNLFELDSMAARQYRLSLNKQVQDDIKMLIRFSKEHENFIEPYVTKLYSLFLRQNQQPQGVLTYDQVNGLLIAYYKKYGRI